MVDDLTGMGGIILYAPLSSLLNTQWQDYTYLDEHPFVEGKYVVTLQEKLTTISNRIAAGQTSGILEVPCGGPGTGLPDTGTKMFGSRIASIIILWAILDDCNTPFVDGIVVSFKEDDAQNLIPLFQIKYGQYHPLSEAFGVIAWIGKSRKLTIENGGKSLLLTGLLADTLAHKEREHQTVQVNLNDIH